jgi:CDGSH-type Zn-finger protein
MTEPVVAARAPAKVTLDVGRDDWLYARKHSHNKPLCDGTHKTLA